MANSNICFPDKALKAVSRRKTEVLAPCAAQRRTQRAHPANGAAQVEASSADLSLSHFHYLISPSHQAWFRCPPVGMHVIFSEPNMT
ncbi:hypothetical protein V5799_027863 [Amblyomma americanum]|uniref:Uncharacterized protein n=1 Tax=Amblyomma americanum TaxID=6943 RepID=A0AAQ4DEH7_AMBAM